MSLRLITTDLDAYEAEQAARHQLDVERYEAAIQARAARIDLTARWEVAVELGDELDVRRVEALIADHDTRHGTQLLAELAA